MPLADWTPTLEDVGAILRARTKDDLGNELGTFTPGTRPTDVQASALISQAQSAVAMVTGSDLPDSVWDDAKGVAARKAAMLIELSYFPEQVNTGRSPYPQLKQLHDDELKQLLTAIENAGGEPPGPSGAPNKPSFAFPVPQRTRSPIPGVIW